MVTLQWKVFRKELECSSDDAIDGGSNKEILAEVEAGVEIPVLDFTITTTYVLSVLLDTHMCIKYSCKLIWPALSCNKYK